MRKTHPAPLDAVLGRAIHGPDRLFDVYTGTDGNDTISGGDGDDVIDGAGGADTISGGGGDNILEGGTGNDVITSSGGADTVDGGDGVDRWTAQYDDSTQSLTIDTRTGSVSNGTTLQNIEAYSIHTGLGNDIIRFFERDVLGIGSGTLGSDIDAGYGSDQLLLDCSTASRRRVVIFEYEGVSGGYRVSANAIDHNQALDARSVEFFTFVGSAQEDQVKIQKDIDLSGLSLDGRAGIDRLTFSSGSAATTFLVHPDGTIDSNVIDARNFEVFDISLAAASSVVMLGDGADTLTAANANDSRIDGGGGDDHISVALSGDALIDGGEGLDALDLRVTGVTYNDDGDVFSTGAQILNFESAHLTFLDSAINLTTGRAALHISTDSLTTVNFDASTFSEALEFVQSDVRLNDPFQTVVPTYDFGNTYVDGNASVRVIGSAHDDTFSLGTFPEQVTVLDGGAGVDRLIANCQNRTAFVVVADGTITTSLGTYSNLEQFDLTLQQGGNVITTGSLADTITVVARQAAPNDLSGGGGDDVIIAGRGDDTLSGNDDNDELVGGTGDDRLNGGAGDDILSGGNGSDTAGDAGATAGVHVALISGQQQDTGGAGKDILVSIENLTGSSFTDRLTGDANANVLVGLGGNDRLFGGDGGDTLQGGTGVDRLTGGAGGDHFVFTRLADFEGGARDHILDFSHAEGDLIDLSAIDPSRRVAGDQAFTFIGSAAFSGATDAFEVRVIQQANGNSLVQFDTDHNGKADDAFIVTADAPLVAADFVL